MNHTRSSKARLIRPGQKLHVTTVVSTARACFALPKPVIQRLVCRPLALEIRLLGAGGVEYLPHARVSKAMLQGTNDGDEILLS